MLILSRQQVTVVQKNFVTRCLKTLWAAWDFADVAQLLQISAITPRPPQSGTAAVPSFPHFTLFLVLLYPFYKKSLQNGILSNCANVDFWIKRLLMMTWRYWTKRTVGIPCELNAKTRIGWYNNLQKNNFFLTKIINQKWHHFAKPLAKSPRAEFAP